jgi:hypothetical protein
MSDGLTRFPAHSDGIYAFNTGIILGIIAGLAISARIDTPIEKILPGVKVCEANGHIASFDAFTITCINGAKFKIENLPEWKNK